MSLDALVGKYPDIFACLEGGNYKLPVNATILCLDAEWHEVGGKNHVLSYQVAALTRTAANNVVHYMDREQRLSLAEVVEAGIRSVNDGRSPRHTAPAATSCTWSPITSPLNGRCCATARKPTSSRT